MILKKYLARAAAYPWEGGNIDISGPVHFAVIPVYDENDRIASTLCSIKAALKKSPEPVKVVLVINEPPEAPECSRLNNQNLLKSIRRNDGKYDGGLVLGDDLFFIDLTDKDISVKYRNVGNARKTGFDECLRQIDGKLTGKNTWFFSLDADTLVSEDYFSSALQWAADNPHAAGAVFHFEHRFDDPDDEVNQAAMRYEIFLRDYAWKLYDCGSIFGFWTIGSAFMCRSCDYVRCGGMRRNAAGEDFYFLQALRKIGQVGIVPGGCVYPAGRISYRVPFGTGPAIAKQLTGHAIELYNQKCFDELKGFFGAAAEADYEQLSGNIKKFAGKKLSEYLDLCRFDDVWPRIVKNTPRRREALQHALQVFCDGFFVLRFCHYLEENYNAEFARQPLRETEDLSAQIARMRLQDRKLFLSEAEK